MVNECFSQFYALHLINVRANLPSLLEFSRFLYSYGYDSSTKTRHCFACFVILALTSIPS